MGLLIDSTVFIHAERRHPTPAELIGEVIHRRGDVPVGISVMRAGELVHGCRRAETPSRRARREEFVESVLAAVPAVRITLPVVRIFGEIDARLSAAGQRVPTSDLLIASTALSRGDEVLTGNIRHFDRIPGLGVERLAL